MNVRCARISLVECQADWGGACEVREASLEAPGMDRSEVSSLWEPLWASDGGSCPSFHIPQRLGTSLPY